MGGEKIAESVVINDEVVKVLEEYTDLAPLHNPACILGIKACQEVMPGKPMVGVFDTAFHQTMPKDKFIYPIPYEYYKKYGVRKYGFHGTSHMFVSQRLAEIENKSLEGTKIVNMSLRTRLKYMCYKRRKINRYKHGINTTWWTSNGYKKWRFRSISCNLYNEKRKFNTCTNGRHFK